MGVLEASRTGLGVPRPSVGPPLLAKDIHVAESPSSHGDFRKQPRVHRQSDAGRWRAGPQGDDAAAVAVSQQRSNVVRQPSRLPVHRPPAPPPSIMARIQKAQSVAMLQEIFSASRLKMDHIHVVTMLRQLVMLRELAYSARPVASPLAGALVEALIAHMRPRLAACLPRQLATCLWALSRLSVCQVAEGSSSSGGSTSTSTSTLGNISAAAPAAAAAAVAEHGRRGTCTTISVGSPDAFCSSTSSGGSPPSTSGTGLRAGDGSGMDNCSSSRGGVVHAGGGWQQRIIEMACQRPLFGLDEMRGLLIESLLADDASHLQSCNAQDAANIAVALARLLITSCSPLRPSDAAAEAVAVDSSSSGGRSGSGGSNGSSDTGSNCKRRRMLPQYMDPAAPLGIWQRLRRVLPRVVPRAQPQELVSLCWAFAHAGIADECLFTAAAPRLTDAVTAGRLDCQQVANTAWAFAKVGCYDSELMAALARRVCSVLRSMSAQGLANTLWAFARLQHRDEELVHQIARCCMWKVRRISGQGLSNLLWGFNIFGYCNQVLLARLSRECMLKLDQLSPLGLASLLALCARASQHVSWRDRSAGRDIASQYREAKLASAQGTAEAAEQEAASGDGGSVSAEGGRKHNMEVMYCTTAARCLELLDSFRPSTLATVVISQIQVGHHDAALLSAASVWLSAGGTSDAGSGAVDDISAGVCCSASGAAPVNPSSSRLAAAEVQPSFKVHLPHDHSATVSRRISELSAAQSCDLAAAFARVEYGQSPLQHSGLQTKKGLLHALTARALVGCGGLASPRPARAASMLPIVPLAGVAATTSADEAEEGHFAEVAAAATTSVDATEVGRWARAMPPARLAPRLCTLAGVMAHSRIADAQLLRSLCGAAALLLRGHMNLRHLAGLACAVATLQSLLQQQQQSHAARGVAAELASAAHGNRTLSSNVSSWRADVSPATSVVPLVAYRSETPATVKTAACASAVRSASEPARPKSHQLPAAGVTAPLHLAAGTALLCGCGGSAPACACDVPLAVSAEASHHTAGGAATGHVPPAGSPVASLHCTAAAAVAATRHVPPANSPETTHCTVAPAAVAAEHHAPLPAVLQPAAQRSTRWDGAVCEDDVRREMEAETGAAVEAAHALLGAAAGVVRVHWVPQLLAGRHVSHPQLGPVACRLVYALGSRSDAADEVAVLSGCASEPGRLHGLAIEPLSLLITGLVAALAVVDAAPVVPPAELAVPPAELAVPPAALADPPAAGNDLWTATPALDAAVHDRSNSTAAHRGNQCQFETSNVPTAALPCASAAVGGRAVDDPLATKHRVHVVHDDIATKRRVRLLRDALEAALQEASFKLTRAPPATLCRLLSALERRRNLFALSAASQARYGGGGGSGVAADAWLSEQEVSEMQRAVEEQLCRCLGSCTSVEQVHSVTELLADPQPLPWRLRSQADATLSRLQSQAAAAMSRQQQQQAGTPPSQPRPDKGRVPGT